MELINSSIVFQIANADVASFLKIFLYSNNVISKDWEIAQVTPKMPPISEIKFKNEYAIKYIENKIIISIEYDKPIDLIKTDILSDDLTKIALKFYEYANFFEFKAIGINFGVLLKANSLTDIIKGLPENSELDAFNFKIQKNDYLISNSSKIVIQKPEDKKLILFENNYHHDLKDYISDPKKLEIKIKEFINRRNDYLKNIRGLISETSI